MSNAEIPFGEISLNFHLVLTQDLHYKEWLLPSGEHFAGIWNIQRL